MEHAPSTTGSSRSNEAAAFEQIDWSRLETDGNRLTAERVAFFVGLIAIGLLYLRYRLRGSIYLVWYWKVGLADWLLLLSVAVVTAYFVVPLARDDRGRRRLLARLRSRPLTVPVLAYLGGVLTVGMYANVGFPSGGLVEFTFANFAPPVWAGGTWEHPIGTDRWGYDMIQLLIAGARPVVYVTVVTAGLIVPLATIVGTVAGYYGGTLDDVLMGYVDVQLSVPAIIIYLVAWMYVGGSMFLLLLAFGLLSWGGIARLVRSETLQRREEGYVLSARAIGAPTPYVLRRHVLPNVTNTVVPATFHLLGVLVLTEAGLSFLGFGPQFQSWGMTIAEGLYYGPATRVWWASTFPAVALALTVAAFKATGDSLRDLLDPRWQP